VAHDNVGLGSPTVPGVTIYDFNELLTAPAVERKDFHFARVPPDHPLWVLFSSGTTGLPKAIVHGHAGMLVEHLKAMMLHVDLSPGKRMFFYTTTGWMVWNSVVAALIAGASTVLYDGSPTFGGLDALWRIAAETRTTSFGASPTLVQGMKLAGVKAGQSFDLSALDSITLAGAPATPETFAWFYDAVNRDIWVGSQSGGTDLCSGLVTGAVTQPVYAGEIQVRPLGIDTHVWNDAGEEIIDETGELVVTSAFPSAPLRFWGDEDASRYRETYFSTFPDVWRHGDLAKINRRGGAYVYGRSDSTLNRFGVRIGTSEIYRILEELPEVVDSLVVCAAQTDGGLYMPLFVTLKGDTHLTEGLKRKIADKLRTGASPRHVPDVILQAPAIPYTLTGKKMEVPVRRMFEGLPLNRIAALDATSSPAALTWFANLANSRFC
jgi:acetoacetyl-CoA synthetase